MSAGPFVFWAGGGRIDIQAQADVTFLPGVTVSGQNGTIYFFGSVAGARAGILRNQGVITANTAGGTITMSGTEVGLKNTGVLRSEGGTLVLATPVTTADLGAIENVTGGISLGGTIDNTGATLALNDTTGPLKLIGGIIKGGTVTESGRGQLAFDNSANQLDAVVLNGDLNLANGQGVVQIVHGFTCSGTVRIDASGTLSCKGVQTMAAGTILFGSQFGLGFISLFDDASQLTLGPTVAIHGLRGQIGRSRTGSIINQGLISADTLNSSLTITSRNFTNDTTGIIEATAAGAAVTISAGTFTDNGLRRTSNGGQIIVTP